MNLAAFRTEAGVPDPAPSRRAGWRRLIVTVACALLLAVAIDATVGWVGDHVSRSLYRFDTKIVTAYAATAATLLFAQTNPQAFIYFQF